MYGMTIQERKSASAAKKLVTALVAIEEFNGDPEDVLRDAEIRMTGESSRGASEALQALIKHYLEE